MPAWLCPTCGRQFARVRQGHECAPAMTLDEYFSTGPPHERPVFDAVMAHVTTLGPVHVEPVSVGIFLKRAGSFLELRPMERWVALWFTLPRRAQHPRIVRKVTSYAAGRYVHVANVRSPDDLDDALRDLLTEAYLTSPEP
jgi:hypothetical protein